jgi:hypothetical protein
MYCFYLACFRLSLVSAAGPLQLCTVQCTASMYCSYLAMFRLSLVSSAGRLQPRAVPNIYTVDPRCAGPRGPAMADSMTSHLNSPGEMSLSRDARHILAIAVPA